MGHDSEPNGSAQYCAVETLLDDQPSGKSSEGAMPTECE
jgi:hypothetical protein